MEKNGGKGAGFVNGMVMESKILGALRDWNFEQNYRTLTNAVNSNPIDDVQTVFDALGNVPVAGELFDGINALIYLGRGQKLNAAASLSAIVPLLGTGLKYGVKGLEKKVLSRAAMSEIWGAGPLRIDPENLHKTVTEDMVEILAGRGIPRLDDFGLQKTVQRNAKWNGALEWQIRDIPGSIGLNSCRIVQHPNGSWGIVINHDYKKIIQIPTSSAIK